MFLVSLWTPRTLSATKVSDEKGISPVTDSMLSSGMQQLWDSLQYSV
jgi:hypothetical protein